MPCRFSLVSALVFCCILLATCASAQESYEDTIIAQLSGISHDIHTIKLDGATSASLLQSILDSQGIYANDLIYIRSDLNSLYRLSYNNLGYLTRLPDIKGLNQDIKGLNQDIKSLNQQQVRLLQAISNSLSRVGGTDVLAGNPWWATNSAFGLTKVGYDLVYPSERPNSQWSFSFPQFLSKWSSFLTLPVGTQNSLTWLSSNWQDQFGYKWKADNFGGSFTREYPYTWHDWMADAMRSNWTERATWRSYVHDVDIAGFASSNAIADDISYQQYQDSHAVNEANDDMRSSTEPEQPDYTVASVDSPADDDREDLLEKPELMVNHTTRLELVNGSDFRSATGVDGDMVFNLEEGRFSTFVSDMSDICTYGWRALLAIASAFLFYRKQVEIMGIVKGTNFSRV